MPPPKPRAAIQRRKTRLPRNLEEPEPQTQVLNHGEYRGPHPTMLQGVADLLRDQEEFARRQVEDPILGEEVRNLASGETGEEYVIDDNGLLLYAPPGSIMRLAIPRSLVAGILALVHTTYGNPGVARTTEHIITKYY